MLNKLPDNVVRRKQYALRTIQPYILGKHFLYKNTHEINPDHTKELENMLFKKLLLLHNMTPDFRQQPIPNKTNASKTTSSWLPLKIHVSCAVMQRKVPSWLTTRRSATPANATTAAANWLSILSNTNRPRQKLFGAQTRQRSTAPARKSLPYAFLF